MMKRHFLLYGLVLVLGALMVPAVQAQMATVKGAVRDREGKPIVGAKVHFVNKENGRKFDIKTDKKGEYYSLGLTSGNYTVTLLDANGQQLFQLGNVRLTLGEENTVNIDLQKEQAQAAQEMTPEQKAAIEAQQKEVSKVKGLNDMLAQTKTAEDAGNFQQAVQIMEQATQADPTRDILWARLADVERSLAKTQTDPSERKATLLKSVEDYKKAIAIKPQAAYYNNMGESLGRAGDVQGAIAAYDQAAQMDPTHAGQFYFNEGAVLTNAGKADEANAAFDKAIQADPTHAESYYQKGVNLLGKATLDKNGKMVAPPGAEQALNKYLELAPTGPNAEAARQILASMGATVETNYGKSKSKKK
jgi:tetratricopeptide (TPR) repeat protein